MLKRYPLMTFFVFAYALTWLAWLPLAIRGPIYGDRLSYLHFLGSLGPLASAFAVTGLVSGRSGIRELLVAGRGVLVLVPTISLLVNPVAV